MKKIHLLGLAAVAMLGAGCASNTQTSVSATDQTSAQTQTSGNGQTQVPTTSDQTQIEAQPSAGATINPGATDQGSMQMNAGAVVNTQPDAPSAGANAGAGAAVNAQVSVQTYPVMIKNFAFSQPVLRVNQGDKVVFTNQDSVQHSATSDNGSFDSGLISQNASYTLDTSKLAPGTYTYHCSVHPMMKATLVVAAKAQ